MPDPAYFISCDWGTSRLRLRLVDFGTMQIKGEVVSEHGIATTFRHWQRVSNKTARGSFFARILGKELVNLGQCTGTKTASLPILCSGMASSSLGIMELPYTSLPFALDGSNAIVAKVVSEVFPNPLFLISGLKAENNVMRGEETEMLGLSWLLPDLPLDYLAILPGTHSKHISVQNGKIVDFATHMTGELFNLLCGHSTLRHSVQAAATIDWPNFHKGIDTSGEQRLLKNLFQVRVNELLHAKGKGANYAFLSGLLIGAELQSLPAPDKSDHIVLLGNNAVSPLYAAALKHLGQEGHLLDIPGDIADKAVLAGQLHLYEQQNTTP